MLTTSKICILEITLKLCSFAVGLDREPIVTNTLYKYRLMSFELGKLGVMAVEVNSSITSIELEAASSENIPVGNCEDVVVIRRGRWQNILLRMTSNGIIESEIYGLTYI